MKAAKCGTFALLGLFAAGGVQAQFMPLEAKIREIHETITSGKAVQTEIREGSYHRSSDGSVLIHWLTKNGETSWDGTLLDNRALVAYRLDYRGRQAFEAPNQPRIAVKPGAYASLKQDIGTDSVEGLRCRILPVRISGTAVPSPLNGGESCVSPEYDLRLWDDVTMVDVNGKAQRTRTEMYDLKMGTEPAPALFDVKSGFTIYSAHSDPTNPQH